jgi:hypothetical protein
VPARDRECRQTIRIGRAPSNVKPFAIAYRALQNGFDVLFTTAAELTDDLSAASREGRMREQLARYLRPHLLLVGATR